MVAPPKTTSDKPAVALIDLRSHYNVGNIARSATAFEFGFLFTVGTTPDLERKEISKTALGGETIPSIHYRSFSDLVTAQKDNFNWIALETGGVDIKEWSPKDRKPILLLVGNERFGLTNEQRQACQTTVSIAHANHQISSLNVANAFAIAAHQLVR